MGRLFISLGVLLIAAGLVLVLAEKAGVRLGRLPGDIRMEGKNGAFYFPVVTCVLISLIASLVAWLFRSR